MNETDRLVLEIYGPGAYLVGGAVRDEMAGVNPKDRDYLVLGMGIPELLQRALDCGLSVQQNRVSNEVVGVRISGKNLPFNGVEVSPPRYEISTGPGHTDFQIRSIPLATQRDAPWGWLLREDLGRRDWTVNAMARSLVDGTVVDPFGGEADMARGLLKLVFPRAIDEDPLRILRGISLVSRLGMQVPPQNAFDAARGNLMHISRERVGDEMRKIMLGDDAWRAAEVMFRTDLWCEVAPMLQRARDFDQRSRYHKDRLDTHLVKVLREASGHRCDSENDLIAFRWAALMHDSGKPFMAWEGKDGNLHFYADPDEPEGVSHEEVGALLVEAALDNIRYPKSISKRAGKLVLNHMITPSGKPQQARRFRRTVGDDTVLSDVWALRMADVHSKGNHVKEEDALVQFGVDISTALAEPCTIRELEVDGYDVACEGLEGAQIGAALERLLDDVIGSPDLNRREWLLKRLRRMVKKEEV